MYIKLYESSLIKHHRVRASFPSPCYVLPSQWWESGLSEDNRQQSLAPTITCSAKKKPCVFNKLCRLCKIEMRLGKIKSLSVFWLQNNPSVLETQVCGLQRNAWSDSHQGLSCPELTAAPSEREWRRKKVITETGLLCSKVSMPTTTWIEPEHSATWNIKRKGITSTFVN